MNNKFFGSKFNTILLFILIILVVVVLRLMIINKEVYLPSLVNKNNTENSPNLIKGNKEDLISFSVGPIMGLEGQTSLSQVKGKMTLTGSIKGAYFFEGNILVNVLDKDKNILKQGHGTATTDWMTVEPVSFTTDIDFTGLPTGRAFIEIHNDNASGLPENDKSILIPINIS